MNDHNCLIIKPRASDYVLGSNSPISFKAVSSGDWTNRLDFFEAQEINGWDTNGCVLFAAQESFDSQMDNLIATNQIPAGTLSQFNAMGYMDIGLDGKTHFHSSPRSLQILTGNGTNGNSCPDAWDVMRKYGVLPWKDLPFDSTITKDSYFAPIPQTSMDKAAKFLTLIGGKNAIQYHWVVNGTAKNVFAMKAALPQAPLCLGIAVTGNWNQATPTDPAPGSAPQHSVMEYAAVDNDSFILDHYIPYEKKLDAGYPINYCLQGIVNPIFAASPIPLPPNPTVQQELTWLGSVKQWLTALLVKLQNNNLQSDDQKVAISEITASMNYPWWVSSTGQGIAQRILSFSALILPLLSAFGINIAQGDVEIVVNSALILVFAVWHVAAWARANFNKENKLGKYSV